ncbi:MAG: hypothetical protein P8M30_05350 [Planctomycetaceae bacterium]|nr:hypothetical protein [Planctomycetaceae bacterium]
METLRRLSSIFAFLMLVMLTSVGSTKAQPNELSIRKIYVPADAPESWPEGNWTPVPSSRLAKRSTLGSSSVADNVWTREARYQATLKKHVLQEGRFQVDIDQPDTQANGPSLLSWQESNVAFSKLNWKNQPAKLGNNTNGDLYLMVPPQVKQLSGQWSVQGRPLSGGVFFDLQFPHSAVTELELLLSANDRIISFDDTPVITLQSSRPQEQRVRLSLGSRAHARIFVSFGDTGSPPPSPQLFTRAETLLSLSRDQSRIRQELLIETLGAEIKTIQFPVPDNLSIRSIDFGGIPLNSWSVSRNKPHTLSVSFPHPISGLSRPLRISGTIDYTEGELWRVPKLLPEGAFSLSELVTLNVSPPLELLAIQREGFRQTAATTNANGAGSLVFQRNSPEGVIDVRLGLPPTRLETQIASRLDVLGQYWVADVNLLGQVSSGRLYSIWMDLADGWEPRSVEFHNQTSMRFSPDLPWTIDRSNGQKILRVELPVAISRTQPLNLKMTFRGPRSETPVIPAIRMTGETPSVQALIIDAESTSPKLNSRLTGWRQLTQSEIPSWITTSEPGTLLSQNLNRRKVWLSTKPGFSVLPVASTLTNPALEVIDQITVSAVEQGPAMVTENIEISLPADADLRNPLLIKTSSDVDLQHLQWSLQGSSNIQVRCLPIESQKESLQSQIKQWELTFEPAISSENVVLMASRQFLADGIIQAILPVPDYDDDVRGRVQLFDQRVSPRNQILVTETRQLERDVSESWESEYESADSQFEFKLGQRAQDSDQQVLKLKLESRLVSPWSEHFSHRLKWPLAAGQDRLVLTLPEEISHYTATVNDQVVLGTVNENGETVFLFQQSQNPSALELVYQSRVAWRQGHFSCDLPVPQSHDFDGRIEWNLKLPEDCRINRYNDQLTLRTPQESLHWSQRLFGPLGRPSTQSIFNPLDSQQWLSLFSQQTDPKDQPLPNSPLTLTFESRTIPTQLSVRVWSRSRQSQTAWSLFFLTLFFGLSLRLTRWEGRTTTAAWLVSALVFASYGIPDDWSLLTGAICAGIILTIFFPRIFLLGRRRLDGSRHNFMPGAEETTLRKVTIGSLMITLIPLFWSTSSAQPSSAQQRSDQAPQTVDLLIPYTGDQPDEELPELIYVRSSQRQSSIFQNQTNQREVLLTGAHYQCRLTAEGPANLKAIFQIEVPVNQVIEYVNIPISGANLARENGCLVAGLPVSVSINSTGALEIPLPKLDPILFEGPLKAPRPGDETKKKKEEFRTLEIELNLYASINIQQATKQFELGIPAIDNSTFHCESAEGITIADFTGARGAVIYSEPQTFIADLGMSRTLVMSWYSQSPEGAEPLQPASPHLVLTSQISINAFPTYLNYRFRVAHQLKAGTLATIRWEVPQNFHYRKVSSGNILQTREFLEGNQRILLFDLEQSIDVESLPFVIDAEFVVPLSVEDEDEIRVEIPQLYHYKIENQTFSETEESLATVGIWSPPELPLTILEVPTQGLRTITADEFLSLWPEDASLQKPQFSYEITGGATLSYLKSESQPQKQAWVKETGTVGKQFLEWDWNGEIQTSRLPAFEHVFLVDPRLEILSVSVKEDQAERLNRWSRDGSRLTLRLSRKAEDSFQEVSIRTRLPLGGDENLQSGEEALQLPDIRLLGGDHVESIAEIYRTPSRSARWDDQTEGSSAQSSSGSSARSEETLFFDLIDRRNGIEDSKVLLIGQKNIPPVLKRELMISKRVDGDFDVVCTLTDIPSESISDALKLLIPTEWIPRFRISTSNHDNSTIDKIITKDGTLKLTIPPDMRFTPITLQSTLSAPTTDHWKMSWPFVSENCIYQNRVSLQLSDGWAPQQECRLSNLTNPKSANSPQAYDSWEYLCDDLELQKTELSDPAAVPIVPLLIARVDVRAGKPLRGHWWLVYRGRGREQLQLDIPLSIKVESVHTNHQPLDFERDAERGELSLKLNASGNWQSFLIDWEETKASEPQIILEQNVPVPRVIDVKVRDQRIILVAEKELKMTMHHGMSPVSQYEFRLSLLESYLRMMKEKEKSPQVLPLDLEWLLGSLLQDTAGAIGTDSLEDAQVQSFQRRFQKAQEDLLAAMPPDSQTQLSERLKSRSEQTELLWQDLMPGVMSATGLPDRQMIYAVVSPQAKKSKVWWISRSWYRGGIAVVAALIGIPLMLWIFRENTADWIAMNRVYAWMAIGLIWWTALELSVIGMLIFAVAVLAWMGNSMRHQSQRA